MSLAVRRNVQSLSASVGSAAPAGLRSGMSGRGGGKRGADGCVTCSRPVEVISVGRQTGMDEGVGGAIIVSLVVPVMLLGGCEDNALNNVGPAKRRSLQSEARRSRHRHVD